ncbi:MAG: Pr6Pr family membrane protein [Bacilli bacterium]
MKKKLSLILNIIIVILTIFASFLMFTGIKITHGAEPILETTKLGMFKFFTVQSNMFMGIMSLVFFIKEIRNKEITKNMYRLKLMSTTAVSLTFIMVFTYLGPISKDGVISLLQNSNIFFHLVIPVLSIITLTLFERTDKLEFKDTLYGLIPTFLYSTMYITNVLIHTENGKVSPKYDFYWLVQNGIQSYIIAGILIPLLTYIISLALWKLNKRR